MKRVLLVDAPILFRDFLKEKLSQEKITVEVADGRRDAFTKMISTLPSLIVLDISNSFKDIVAFLEKKRQDPNASLIPIIVTGPIISKEQVSYLQHHNVVKYFNKPINFDTFFESIGRLLKISITMDNTPCILETHLNDNIIIVEVAKGLNREKMGLLKYKLSEIIDENHINVPKIVIMLTDLDLTFVDGVNLEILFNSVVYDSRIQKRNVKVLSLSNFVKELIEGHEEFNGIEVSTNLTSVLNSLVDNNDQDDLNEIISDRILSKSTDATEGSVQTRFYSDSASSNSEPQKINDGSKYHIALIDDDMYTRSFVLKIFSAVGGKVDFYESGSEFVAAINKNIYDLVILDLFMSGLSGYDILVNIHRKKYPAPVLIYSSVTSKDAIMQALNLGAKSFFVKHLSPDVFLQKSLELIKASIK